VDSPGDVTVLLHAIRAGDAQAKGRLAALVYGELRGVAAGLMGRERGDHTLQPTALVHEAFVRLFRDDLWRTAPNRSYLFGAAARAMREVLADHARRRRAAKRGGTVRRVPLDDLLDHLEHEQNVDVLALHESLDRLSALHDRQSQVVTLRFFGGFTVAEIAGLLGLSVSTVEADFRLARAWLRQQLKGDAA
jgi:RNA polymerase sigma factor (TIGR02999 family)